MGSIELSYCVVNTSQRGLLVRGLDAIARERAELPFATEVLVLDNGSRDGSAEAAQAHTTVDEVIALAERRGKALNDSELLRRARGRYALLLNEDSELLPGATRALHAALAEHPRAACAGARLLRPDGDRDGDGDDEGDRDGDDDGDDQGDRDRDGDDQGDRDGDDDGDDQGDRDRDGDGDDQGDRDDGAKGAAPASAWRFPSVLTALAGAVRMHRLYTVQSRGTRVRQVDWCQSAALLVRREAAAQVGYLDPDFFVYSDEVDFARRLRDAGWISLWVPAAAAIHHEQLSTDAVPERRIVEMARNRDLYMRKHHSAAAARAVRWLTAWSYALRALAALALPGHSPRRYWRHVIATLWPARGEGLREAAERYNREAHRSG